MKTRALLLQSLLFFFLALTICGLSLYYYLLPYPLVLIVRFVLIWVSIYLLARIFVYQFIRNDKIGPGGKNLSLSLFTLLFTFLALESVFTFLPRSHSLGFTFGSRNWFLYHWRENEEGFRDENWRKKDSSKRNIVFLGDSFTAGHGLQYRKNRFSDLAARELSRNFTFFNLGKNGADSKEEIKTLSEFPYPIDILVLQYYGNDIEADIPKPSTSPPEAHLFSLHSIKSLAFQCSFLVNYLYWLSPKDIHRPYHEAFVNGYQDSVLLETHLSTLNRLFNLAKSKARLVIFLPIPFLNEVESSRSLYMEPVEQLARSKGLVVYEPSSELAAIPFRRRVINRNDLHASREANKVIAEGLLRLIAEKNFN